MREAGFETDSDPSIRAKLEEVGSLERSIGKTGMLALKPFINTSTQDLWQLNLLDGTQ
jgi:protease PrsW